jgi:SsrA-binding protein
MSDGRKVIARNRKAHHQYHIQNTYEAGLVLRGSEIKSIRDNKISLQDGFVTEQDGELWLMGVHISPYDKASLFGHTDATRPRKLLLHKREIAKIITQLRERGATAVPLQVYLIRGRAKVEIALAKGKKLYDKRQTIAKRDVEREIRRNLKNRHG